jgi:hypothetical protein
MSEVEEGRTHVGRKKYRERKNKIRDGVWNGRFGVRIPAEELDFLYSTNHPDRV